VPDLIGIQREDTAGDTMRSFMIYTAHEIGLLF